MRIRWLQVFLALVFMGCEQSPLPATKEGVSLKRQKEVISLGQSRREQVEKVLARSLSDVPIGKRYRAVTQKADDLWRFLRDFPSNDMDCAILIAARFQRELEQELQGIGIPQKTVDLGPLHVSKDGTHYYMATEEIARESSKEDRCISEVKGYRAQLIHFLTYYPNRFDSPTIKARYEILPPERKAKVMEKIIEVLDRPPRWDVD